MSHVGTKPRESVVIRSCDGGTFWNICEYIMVSVMMSKYVPVLVTRRVLRLDLYLLLLFPDGPEW